MSLKDQKMEAEPDPCIATVDRKGVPYNARLKRVRESLAKPAEDVAESLGITFAEYDEWETFEGELNMVMTLGELSRLATVLGVRTKFLFEDDSDAEQLVSPEQLC